VEEKTAAIMPDIALRMPAPGVRAEANRWRRGKNKKADSCDATGYRLQG